MVIFENKGCVVHELWLDEQSRIDGKHGQNGCDILVRHFAPSKDCGWLENASSTMLVALDDHTDRIWKRIDQSTRYEIRRATSRDGVSFTVEDTTQSKVIQDFVETFAAMALAKGLAPVNSKRIRTLQSSGSLVLTSATLPSSGGSIYHAYVIGCSWVRLLWSVSDRFGSTDPVYRQQVGRANRALHWFDMELFKERGFLRYDLGGWYVGLTDQALLLINDFKQGFGGDVVTVFSGTTASTIRGRSLLAVESAIMRLRRQA